MKLHKAMLIASPFELVTYIVARKQVPVCRWWDGFEETIPLSIKHFLIKAFAPWRNSR